MKDWVGHLVGIVVCCAIVFLGVKAFLRPYEHPDAWTIIKQPTNAHFAIDNYGFVSVSGSWVLGFSNKASAVTAMKQARSHHRNPPKPNKPRKAIDEWRVQ